MLYRGVSASGSLDLSSSLISGKLETGSAGLFVCFFAFIIILFSLVSSLRVPAESSPDRLAQAFWGVLFALIACVGATLVKGTSGTALYFAIGLLGSLLFSLAVALMRRESNA